MDDRTVVSPTDLFKKICHAAHIRLFAGPALADIDLAYDDVYDGAQVSLPYDRLMAKINRLRATGGKLWI